MARSVIEQLGDEDKQAASAKKLEVLARTPTCPSPCRRVHADADVPLRALVIVVTIERNEAGEVCRFVGHTDGIYSLSVSPDGKRLVSELYVNREPVARVWEIATGKEIHQLKTQRFGVHAADWSPDGKQIVTGGGDSMLRIGAPPPARS